jgi:hypothetical protein
MNTHIQEHITALMNSDTHIGLMNTDIHTHIPEIMNTKIQKHIPGVMNATAACKVPPPKKLNIKL